MDEQARFRGALLGLACGDAVGTTVEFQPRGTFEPVTDMVGQGPFHLQAGQWTDDTSMALCLATSLVEMGKFDPADQMKRYCNWMNNGYLSSTGHCFDIGVTTAGALRYYLATGNPYSGPTDLQSAGNGSIMRLAPASLFFYPDIAAAIHFGGESSRTTHGAAEAVDACRLFSALLCKALAGEPKELILFGTHFPAGVDVALSPKIQALAEGIYRDKRASAIVANGYVVNSLEAALWSFWSTDNFRDAILAAVNLGDDADTTAAVCGQLAGAYYGESGIPKTWLTHLTMLTEIKALADRLFLTNLGA